MFARTKRLMLRPGWPEDAAALAGAIGHAAVVRNLSRAPWPYTRADAEAFLSLPRGAEQPMFLILAHDRGTAPELVGGIELCCAGRVAELGYWLTPSAWGRGFATEAGEAAVAMARHTLPLDRLSATAAIDNPASARVLAKLGFRAVAGTEMRPSLGRDGPVEAARFELDLATPAAMPMAA